MEMWETISKERAVRAWRRSIQKDLKEVGGQQNAASVTQMHSRQQIEQKNRLKPIDTTNPLDLPTENNTRDTRHKAVYDNQSLQKSALPRGSSKRVSVRLID